MIAKTVIMTLWLFNGPPVIREFDADKCAAIEEALAKNLPVIVRVDRGRTVRAIAVDCGPPLELSAL